MSWRPARSACATCRPGPRSWCRSRSSPRDRPRARRASPRSVGGLTPRHERPGRQSRRRPGTAKSAMGRGFERAAANRAIDRHAALGDHRTRRVPSLARSASHARSAVPIRANPPRHHDRRGGGASPVLRCEWRLRCGSGARAPATGGCGGNCPCPRPGRHRSGRCEPQHDVPRRPGSSPARS